MMIHSAIIFVLLALNALYVASEFAAVGVRRTVVEQLASEGSALARKLLPIISDSVKLDSYIAVCQIGISFTSLILGAYGEYAFAHSLASTIQRYSDLSPAAALSAAALLVLVCLTVSQVVLGELLPKSIAMRYPAATAMATLTPMRWSSVLFGKSGFLGLLNGSGALILKLFRLPLHARRHVHQAEEIDILVEETHEVGLLDAAERERLHNVFRLANRKVREVMVPRVRVFALSIDTPEEELISQCIDSAYTRIPVYREDLDSVLGVIHVKDLLSLTYANGDEFAIESAIRPIPRVLETVPINRLLTDMRAAHNQISLVVDEYGGTSGIVTLEDLLEEVIGDIPDEYDKQGGHEASTLPDGRVRIDGASTLSDASEMLGGVIEYEGADTVAGLMMGVLGRVPEDGDQILVQGCLFLAEQTSGHSLERVLVTGGAVGPETPVDD